MTSAAIVQTSLRFVASVVIEAAAMLGRAGLFVVLAVALGMGTSWYLGSQPSMLTATIQGPWVNWTAAGRSDADPYTRARFARLGSLPFSAAVVQTFEARADSTGQRLQSFCDYLVEGRPFDAPWWSIAVYGEQGELIANPSGRHGFNGQTISLAPDGSYLISLSRDATPGNWLPTGGAGRLVLLLTVHRAAAGAKEIEAQLPTIRRGLCH